MAILTLGMFRKMTEHLPESWPVVVRDIDCATQEFDDYDVIIAGIKDGDKVIILSEAHVP